MAIKSEPVLKHYGHHKSFFIRKRVKPALMREGASDMPNIGACRVYIRPEIHEVNDELMARALGNDRSN
jgi:hypothetical protein